jgi:DNA invertase Pin-like site-specific DNA recombinase
MRMQREPTGRALGYVRVSTKRQDLSPDKQAERIGHRAAEREWTLDVVEERMSAKRAATRPQLQYCLAELAAGRADALLTDKLDRIARNLRDFLRLDDLARREGWALIVLNLDFDSSNATGRLVRNVMAAIAEWEREMIGERVQDALAVKRDREPDWRPGPASEIAADVEARIVALSAEGRSRAAIAELLNDDQVPTARGGRWHASTVARVLARSAS